MDTVFIMFLLTYFLRICLLRPQEEEGPIEESSSADVHLTSGAVFSPLVGAGLDSKQHLMSCYQ